MSTKSTLPIYARLGERELPVGWAWYRPEPQVGDTVRICADANDHNGWQSYRVVGKWLRAEHTLVGAQSAADAPKIKTDSRRSPFRNRS